MTTKRDCACGCGEPAPRAKRSIGRLGVRRGDLLPYRTGHNTRNRSDPLRRIIRGATPDACWLWQGAHNRKGYGRIQHRRVHSNAHRVVYELLVGAIPPGFHLDHLCLNTGCVNPAHMEPVTPAENVRRQHARRRMIAVTQ